MMHQRDLKPRQEPAKGASVPHHAERSLGSDFAALEHSAFPERRAEPAEVAAQSVSASQKVIDLPKCMNCFFDPIAIEKWGNGRLYELLGVRMYKYVMPNEGDLVNKWSRSHLFTSGTRESNLMEMQVTSWGRNTKFLELVHVAAGALMAALTIGELALFGTANPVILGVNIIGNLYPVMTQRYNRVRINSVLERRAELRAKRDACNDYGESDLAG